MPTSLAIKQLVLGQPSRHRGRFGDGFGGGSSHLDIAEIADLFPRLDDGLGDGGGRDKLLGTNGFDDALRRSNGDRVALGAADQAQRRTPGIDRSPQSHVRKRLTYQQLLVFGYLQPAQLILAEVGEGGRVALAFRAETTNDGSRITCVLQAIRVHEGSPSRYIPCRSFYPSSGLLAVFGGARRHDERGDDDKEESGETGAHPGRHPLEPRTTGL